MNGNELTETQINQQDLIDNAIYHFIQGLNPSDKEIPWNIEMIGDVRDTLREWFVIKLKITEGQEFYPYKEEDFY